MVKRQNQLQLELVLYAILILVKSSYFVCIDSLPIDSEFVLPAPLPEWPDQGGEGPGGWFATGVIDIGGGLQVAQVTTFTRIWSSLEGGPGNLGATFFDPSPIPEGYAFLGSYAQPNNRPLSGWVLVAKQKEEECKNCLVNPITYALVWSSEPYGDRVKTQDGHVYVWFPIPPPGYTSLGHVVTTSPDKPPLDRIRCVREDLTEPIRPNAFVWESNALIISTSSPVNIGVSAAGVPVGTFTARVNGGPKNPQLPPSTSCLKNSHINKLSSTMPDMPQIKALMEAYAPIIYLHPDDEYRPSSVNWFFANGALLYAKGNEANPVPIKPNGSNLPQGTGAAGAGADNYWIDLPGGSVDNDKAAERLKGGDLASFTCYVHVKPMLGGTHTDLVTWVFYPFNGPGRAKLQVKSNVPLGKIGQHVGDWEHVTVRISNFDGEIRMAYMSQHAKGVWVDAPDLEYRIGTNRVVAYSAFHGHSMYPHPGVFIRGSNFVGIRDDAVKRDDLFLDCAKRYELIAADYQSGPGPGAVVVVQPPWLNYIAGQWGPKKTFDLGNQLNKITEFLPGVLKKEFEMIVRKLPPEALGEEGPTGPKLKSNWVGDE